jgi:hypothetical protein
VTNSQSENVGLRTVEFIEADPRQDEYELVEFPEPTDIVYKLDYDSDLRYLKLNTFTIQTFQFESKAVSSS